jgi:hypothetical protein
MKTIWITTSIVITLLMSSCNSLVSNSSTPTPGEPNTLATPTANADTTYPLLITAMGDFAVVSARVVDKAHEDKAPDGYQFLLIGLAQPDLQKIVFGEFPLESFRDMALSSDDNEIYILAGDGSQTPYRGMVGWLDENEAVMDDFVMGFVVPMADTYTLCWTTNPPIPLEIGE